ncbi:hypothetical protein [Glaciimonas soli]|uniref:Uncharacterized protein n=1 Tax=Glaciimonas soli TaxID=2590999 RepID=A0A843YT85_9BURK|nr:hypothetical protein [Glaciimonas soli]MQR00708.1 hypothetical protein [Glaciimonas soli]
MPAYRVSIARPSTNSPLYDWVQTVVASSSAAAIQECYANWVAAKPIPAPPLLSKCRALTFPNKPKVQAARAGVLPMQQAFIDGVEKQVTQLLSTRLDGAFSMINYPSGFNYGITDGSNTYYNQAALQDIDTLLGVASNGRPELIAGGFSRLYARIMGAVTFSFSQYDQAIMARQDAVASAQIAAILSEFENVGGRYKKPLSFGGKLQDIFNQINATYGSVPNMPASLHSLRNAIAAYHSISGDSYVLHNRYYAATARLAAIVANVTKPSQTNGGMQVSDMDDYVGFTPNKLPTANQLVVGLNASTNAISVAINISDFGSYSAQLSIAGGASFTIPIVDILDIAVNAGASHDLSRYITSQSKITMNVTYPGVTMFASNPSVLSADNTTGWYADDVLQEIAAQTGKDATGYQLQGSEFDVAKLFGPGKALSRLKTFVISQQPTISITFAGSNASGITSDFQVNAAVQLKLLGMFDFGGASGSYSVQKINAGSSSGSVTVTLGPPVISGTTPIQQQKAYVLGGVVSCSPANV